MTLKEKIQKEIEKIKKIREYAAEKFKKYRRGEITKEELLRSIDNVLIIFDEKRKEVLAQDKKEFFEKCNELIQEGWVFLRFDYDILFGDTICLKSASFYKKNPNSIKSEKFVIIDYIEKFLEIELEKKNIYIDCNILDEFLDGKISENSFKRIVTTPCIF